MPVDINGNQIISLSAKLNNSTKFVTSGLVWYYDAGIADSYPGSSTTITDFTGNGNNATLSDYSFVTTYGGAFSNSSTGTGSPGIQVPLTNFSKSVGTCEFWMRPTSWDAATGIFINRSDDTANASDWWWLGPYGAGSTLYFRLGNTSGCCGNDNSIGSWSSTHPTNVWGHYCVTWNSGVESKIYFNGTLRQTVSITAIPSSNPSSTGRWGLGHANTNSRWIGQMATFRHYNRVLTASEVLQNYQSESRRFGK